jgi:hypothetical protein
VVVVFEVEGRRCGNVGDEVRGSCDNAEFGVVGHGSRGNKRLMCTHYDHPDTVTFLILLSSYMDR